MVRIQLSYAEKILNALSRTAHKRGDLIGNMQRDADAINEVLKPLFDERDKLRAEVAAMQGVVEAAERAKRMYDVMPWCRDKPDGEYTCVPSSVWKEWNYGPMHDVNETLQALAEARKGEG